MRFPDDGSVFDFFIDPTTKKGALLSMLLSVLLCMLLSMLLSMLLCMSSCRDRV